MLLPCGSGIADGQGAGGIYSSIVPNLRRAGRADTRPDFLTLCSRPALTGGAPPASEPAGPAPPLRIYVNTVFVWELRVDWRYLLISKYFRSLHPYS
ncbi:hypothetical protein [Kamptonema formosum]|uniref:hypothetical protein n=1 Tax=Kamptonema formosum TaxID=331992 RepID=UPI00034D8AB9|nr:hypothetical protein [Oscillatoria sp. PCC 10802]